MRLRRAQPGDADFVAELLAHEDVEPFLRPKARESVVTDIERSLAEPADAGTRSPALRYR